MTDQPIGGSREIQIVPLREQDKYREQGWTIEPLAGHHGAWSVLAWREAGAKDD